MEENFFKKNFFTPSRNSFSGYTFFHLTDISPCENSFSVKLKRFFNEFFILASENRKSIFLVEAFEIRGWQFQLAETAFLACRTYFSHFSDTPSSESYFPASGKVFLKEFSNPYGGDACSVLLKPISLT